MTQIIAVHSFRGGTGKSNLTANLATSLGLNGKRVAVLDTDLASPGIHVLFDFELDENQKCLNDFLQEACPIKECVHEVTPDVMKALKGQIFLLPASLDSDRIARLLREGYQVEKLNDAIFAIVLSSAARDNVERVWSSWETSMRGRQHGTVVCPLTVQTEPESNRVGVLIEPTIDY